MRKLLLVPNRSIRFTTFRNHIVSASVMPSTKRRNSVWNIRTYICYNHSSKITSSKLKRKKSSFNTNQKNKEIKEFLIISSMQFHTKKKKKQNFNNILNHQNPIVHQLPLSKSKWIREMKQQSKTYKMNIPDNRWQLSLKVNVKRAYCHVLWKIP